MPQLAAAHWDWLTTARRRRRRRRWWTKVDYSVAAAAAAECAVLGRPASIVGRGRELKSSVHSWCSSGRTPRPRAQSCTACWRCYRVCSKRWAQWVCVSAPQPSSVQNLFSSNTLGGHISTLSLQVRESQIFFCQIVVPNNNSIGSWIICLISIKGFQWFFFRNRR